MLLAQFFNPLSHKFIVLGLLGPFPVFVKVWATICDPTKIYNGSFLSFLTSLFLFSLSLSLSLSLLSFVSWVNWFVGIGMGQSGLRVDLWFRLVCGSMGINLVCGYWCGCAVDISVVVLWFVGFSMGQFVWFLLSFAVVWFLIWSDCFVLFFIF